VALGLHLFEDVQEALFALGVGRSDQVGGPLDSLDQLAIHVLRLNQVEAIDEIHVRIGDQRVRQVVLDCELLLVLDGIARDAKDDDTGLT
jgi:hypothetical protein